MPKAEGGVRGQWPKAITQGSPPGVGAAPHVHWWRLPAKDLEESGGKSRPVQQKPETRSAQWTLTLACWPNCETRLLFIVRRWGTHLPSLSFSFWVDSPTTYNTCPVNAGYLCFIFSSLLSIMVAASALGYCTFKNCVDQWGWGSNPMSPNRSFSWDSLTQYQHPWFLTRRDSSLSYHKAHIYPLSLENK